MLGRKIWSLLVLVFSLIMLWTGLAGCGQTAQATPTATLEPTRTPQPTATFTATPPPTLTPEPLPVTFGPTNFPPDINPLTGLKVENPALLERRPIVIKVSNLPRYVRPQWGLSRADLVFEYYTEYGTTRFAAIFYGRDADMVGPIRSGRLIDAHFVRGYKAIFTFGLADRRVLNRLYGTEFEDRLVVESPSTPLFRYDPGGYSFLMANTAELSRYINEKGVENGRQNLDGMFFQQEPPVGAPMPQFTVRFSSSIYNRWQYDTELGKYLRFSDTVDDKELGKGMRFEQAFDRLTGEPLAFDNVVVMFVLNEYYSRNPEIIDIQLIGSGPAYLFRDGQVYQVYWQRNGVYEVVSLADESGAPFPFKPGTTWFEIVGLSSTVSESEEGLFFQHKMP
ncbi:MAG: DUF3048 domain-containing protein [Anaerolineales bacterium]|nr:DUF3048 domain-containing protein [Anaerolineales bacterium]MCX7609090.1 DUF3048 domain-containing protein [Anaerolineales bacterium]MDW8226988.1 DUF3048 domain-containing protein [Anaerolineales bacterium]